MKMPKLQTLILKRKKGLLWLLHTKAPSPWGLKDSPWLEKAMLADSLLGMELLENVPVSGTASLSNMDL